MVRAARTTGGADTRAVDVVWLDVRMWTGLRGAYQPFIDVACEPPEPLPVEPTGWQRWAGLNLESVAAQEGWQPGRYHFSAEHRDDSGHTLEVFAQGLWELVPAS